MKKKIIKTNLEYEAQTLARLEACACPFCQKKDSFHAGQTRFKCDTCGAEWIVKKSTIKKRELYKETMQLINDIYEFAPCGGALHIVLDDGNNESCHLQWCIENAIHENNGYSSAQNEMFLRCAENLLKMSESERSKIERDYYILNKR